MPTDINEVKRWAPYKMKEESWEDGNEGRQRGSETFNGGET